GKDQEMVRAPQRSLHRGRRAHGQSQAETAGGVPQIRRTNRGHVQRALGMSVRTSIFALPMPGFFRLACIRRLAGLTASAFGVSPRRISCLADYAAFTAEQAE